MFRILIFVALFVKAYSQSDPPAILETVTYNAGANTVDVLLKCYNGDGVIAEVEIVDSGNDGNCILPFSPITAGTHLRIELQINTNTQQIVTPAALVPCDVTEIQPSGPQILKLVVRFYTSAGTDSPADKTFDILLEGVDEVDSRNTGQLVNPPPTYPTVIPVSQATYTFALNVLDESGSEVNTLNLGDAFILEFVMTVDPFEENLEYKCARVVSCITDVDNSFSNNVRTIIGADGCQTGEFLTAKMVDTHFAKHSSNVVGTTQTYRARADDAEMRGYSMEDPTGNNEIYFRCTIIPSFDDSDAGICGTSHCIPARRKRDVSNSTTVTTSVTVRPRKRDVDDNDCDCEEPLLVYGSAGGLGIVAFTCFIVMMLTYVNVKLSFASGSGNESRSSHSTGKSPSSSLPPMPYIGDVKGYTA